MDTLANAFSTVHGFRWSSGPQSKRSSNYKLGSTSGTGGKGFCDTLPNAPTQAVDLVPSFSITRPSKVHTRPGPPSPGDGTFEPSLPSFGASHQYIMSSARPRYGNRPSVPSSNQQTSIRRPTKKIRKDLAPQASFELTPLSSLIAQSYMDIKALKAIQKRGGALCRSQVAPNDFLKIENNLKKFEELYNQFLRYGGRFSLPAEEVHLVAIMCKRSEMTRGAVMTSASVPLLKAEDGRDGL